MAQPQANCPQLPEVDGGVDPLRRPKNELVEEVRPSALIRDVRPEENVRLEGHERHTGEEMTGVGPPGKVGPYLQRPLKDDRLIQEIPLLVQKKLERVHAKAT